MAEELAAVDSADEKAAADTAADQQSRPMDGSVKTYTEQEVDARIKARIDKQNAKHADEMAKLAQRIEELEARSASVEAERDKLKVESERAAWAEAASAATGVPKSLLRGESAEEYMAHAEDIKKAMPKRFVVPDSGASAKSDRSNKDVFSEFMSANFNR